MCPITAMFILAGATSGGEEWRPPAFASQAEVRPTGALADRLEHSLARLQKPPFTLPFIAADVSFSEKRIFTEYSGDISGRVLGVSAAEKASGRTPRWPVVDLLRELSKYQKSDGHFGADQDLKANIVGDRDMPILWGNDRLLIGLVEAYEATRDPLALAMARRLGDYYLNTDAILDRTELVDKFGNYAAGFATCYFSGIEGLAGLSRITKDHRYLDQAVRMGALMAKTTAPKEQHSHGRLCALRGLLDIYEATGERAYLDQVAAEHQAWVKQFLWPTGGISEMSIPSFQRNEGCTEADWLRINLRLWRLTGHDSYLDLAEMTLKNELAVDQFANGGFGHRVAAFAGGRMDGYFPASHQGTQEAYWCCSEHGPRALLDVAPSEVAVRGKEVFLNLYEPMEATLKVDGRTVHLTVVSQGMGEHISVTVRAERPVRFALKLRVPSWLRDFRVNDHSVRKDEESRAIVERTWRGSETLTLDMPFALCCREDGAPAAAPGRIAKSVAGACLYFGSYLMVYDAAPDGKAATAATASFQQVEEAVRRDGKAEVRLEDGSVLTLRPVASLSAEAGFRCRISLTP